MRNHRIFSVLVLAVAIAAAGTWESMLHSSERRFGPRAVIGDVHVGGLGGEEAVQHVEARLLKRFDAGVDVVVDRDLVRTVALGELGVTFDARQSVLKALEHERQSGGGFAARLAAGRVHPLVWSIDEEALRATLSDLAQAVYHPPLSARVERETEAIRPERPGRTLSHEAATRAVHAWVVAFSSGERISGDARPTVTIPTESEQPFVLAEDLRALKESEPALGRHLLTGYTTRFDPNDIGRTHNLALAAKMIDGAVLRPGESFSFNEIVGPRTLERGFRPAPEIVGEAFVEGIGGGICQVSSTLYNAVLYADLTVLERYRHSVPLGYVPAGRDATLHYGVMDFRFRNNTEQVVLIQSEVHEDRLRISLWGSVPSERNVTLMSEIRPIPIPDRVTVDSRLSPGEFVVDSAGAPGQWIIVEKQVRDRATGELVKEGIVSRNHYPPKPRKIRLGPAESLVD